MNSAQLIKALNDAGYGGWRAYSGRGMFGKKCIGIELENRDALWRMAWNFGDLGEDIPPPQTDTMGYGIIAYWPGIAWAKPPYDEWCRDPKACEGKGYCPLDPTCGD